MEAIAIREVTPEVQVIESTEDAQAVETAIKRAPRFKFSLVNIPVGSRLQFTQDEKIEAVVHSDTEIFFEGTITSLSAAALLATHRLGYKTPSAAGPWYWLYEGQTLDSLRRQLEQEAI